MCEKAEILLACIVNHVSPLKLAISVIHIRYSYLLLLEMVVK
jgi:hypothetical protein